VDCATEPSMCVVVCNRESPMNTTATTFSSGSNAKRAAEAMIAKGTAPALDYGIKQREDGRFEIIWKTAASTTATSGLSLRTKL
jgi:hypothetical protein